MTTLPEQTYEFYAGLLKPMHSDVTYGSHRLRPKHSICTTLEQEKECEMLAPFTDANGHELWSDDVVLNGNGDECILRYGMYTAYDEACSYSGWGWYLQCAQTNADNGEILMYEILPVVPETPGFIVYKSRFEETKPAWYAEYESLSAKWNEAYDKFKREQKALQEREQHADSI